MFPIVGLVRTAVPLPHVEGGLIKLDVAQDKAETWIDFHIRLRVKTAGWGTAFIIILGILNELGIIR